MSAGWRAVLGALLGWLLCGAAAASLKDGERIYREGVLPSGAPLQGTVGTDVELRGARAACINCHRRSGYGAMEGNRVVPPITAAYLFGSPPRPQMNGTRAHYDRSTLRRALREGVHHSGRPLQAPMPRYALADADLDLLIDYLATLSATPPPGVTDSEIHFATIVTPEVPPQRRQTLLDVMHAFINAQNAARREPPPRTTIGHQRNYRATHQWRLHVWELQGPPPSWPAQLDRHVRAQPVYAVLGGVGRDWREIHAYCERRALPCLFPNVDHAQPAEQDFFSIYYTRGVIQEAQVLAQALRDQPRAGPRRLVQVFRAADSGAHAAQALHRALADAPEFVLRDRPLSPAAVLDAGFWQAVRAENPEAVVLWLRDVDLAALTDAPAAGVPLYVSDSLLDDPARALPVTRRSQTIVLRLRALPADWHDRGNRIERWLQGYGLTPSDLRIQTNTYHLLTLVSRVLTHMRANFSREYLLERIEHQVQSSAGSSLYGQLSLGPGRRVASTGGYRVALQVDGSLPAAGEWIVPAFPSNP
jgi:hypothetical protein